MREIKFRAWDKDNEEWCDDFCIELSSGRLLCDHGQTAYVQEIILEQFTGLKDKNGKEIYEGDIVKKCMRPETSETCMVYDGAIGEIKYSKWGVGEFVIDLLQGDECSFYYPDGRNFGTEELEVIGNIHENPELLKNI